MNRVNIGWIESDVARHETFTLNINKKKNYILF
jgi:hypothetical protein